VVERISDEYREATMKVLRMAFLSSLALEFFATVSIAIVAVLIGFRLLFADMGFESGFFILLLAPEFYLPLRSLGAHYHARMDAIASSERIIEILQSETYSDTHRSLEFNQRAISISIQNVSFQYQDRPALNDISFNIPAAKHLALVGPSGSGKTTLVNLLLGFIQAEQGQILVNQLDLNHLVLESWRKNIAWIPQRPRLFSTTIAENVSLGLTDVSEEQVIQALHQAHAMEFVEQLPRGIHTPVGEGNQGLSGGQIQRLALARAFIRDPGLMILDEPTAHLDRHSESLIQQALQQYAKGRTVISIAHRLNTIQQADHIVVLDQGRVVQQGTHQQLQAQAGLYQQLILANEILA
jgi:ATP-binding cassette, subfamily C, bacterial CydD